MASILYRDAACTDARSPRLQMGTSLLVEGRTISWMGPTGEEPDPGSDTTIVDAGGTTIVPAMVDAHSHISLPGGSHWIDRINDSTDDLLAAAERNGERLIAAGIRWARDVGSPTRPVDGAERALGLVVRDRWAGRHDRPYIRAAGTWIGKEGALPGARFLVQAADADALLEAALGQLDDGADLIKLYMDGPDADTPVFTADEIAGVVGAAAEAGAKVAAHATQIGGARAAVAGGVASVEHGDAIDADLAAEMARRGTFLVTTHSVMKSWLSFGTTTTIERFAGEGSAARIEGRLEAARHSTRTAHAAGVKIAAGSDFGGGSLRAGHLAWEVEALVEAGLEPWEALAAATWRGGELLGEPRAGVLRVGGPSDCFLVHGDPLSDPSALWRVAAVL
ncbi:MAG: amidohydrolase family protein [Actinobacteria bacterium]|nr:amidohydrolase family protein [Actinomycetota bacterium]MBU1493337.1 amidohydrolase family protein [Actinomycetota bacterium]